MDGFKLMKELKLNYEQEVDYLPKETGLSLIETTMQVRTLDAQSIHAPMLTIINSIIFF